MASEATIFLVSSDRIFCGNLREMPIEGVRSVLCFHEGQSFLNHFQSTWPGCILLEANLSDMDGLEVLKKLNLRQSKTPVIMLTAYNNVPLAVEAMKQGAFDFLVKPIQEQVLRDRVENAFNFDGQLHQEQDATEQIAARVGQLTGRERQVMDLLIAGLSNKGIAYELGISRKTVDIHRAHIMIKLGLDTLADLVRTGLTLKFNNNLLVHHHKCLQTYHPGNI